MKNFIKKVLEEIIFRVVGAVIVLLILGVFLGIFYIVSDPFIAIGCMFLLCLSWVIGRTIYHEWWILR